ncbi:MAG: carbohydrate ABC transporter permease [Chloroflexota bacterium]
MTTITQEVTVTPTRKASRPAWLPKRWYTHLILWIACFLLGLPLLYSFMIGTQNNAEVYTYKFGIGSTLQDNLVNALITRNLGQFMLNTILVAFIITVGKTILSLLSGLAFVYFRFPGKWIVYDFVLLTLMMPTEVLIIALSRLVVQLDWPKNAYLLALTVPFLASATGTFLFRQHFANIPAELSEAAQLDGATPLQFLFQILIPVSWNTIGALAVIQFVYVWNMYLWPRIIVQDNSRQLIQVGLSTLVGTDTAMQFGPMMLGAVIASVPPVIVFVLLQKQFMSGFALTRDK